MALKVPDGSEESAYARVIRTLARIFIEKHLPLSRTPLTCGAQRWQVEIYSPRTSGAYPHAIPNVLTQGFNILRDTGPNPLHSVLSHDSGFPVNIKVSMDKYL